MDYATNELLQPFQQAYDLHDCVDWKRGILWFMTDAITEHQPEPWMATVIMDFIKLKHAELDMIGVPYRKDSEYERFTRINLTGEGKEDREYVN